MMTVEFVLSKRPVLKITMALFFLTGWLAQLLSARCRRGRSGCDSRAGQIGTKSPTPRHRYDVSSELCCPAA